MNLQDYKKANLPDAPGVYFFRGSKKEILYIGKSTSLKDRVKSYFGNDLISTRGPLLVEMMNLAKTITFEQTDSVLEALLLETQLIKKFSPAFNSREKDDKSYNHILITKEDYPRVLLVRGRDLPTDFPPDSRLYLMGPFPYGSALKEAIKIIRKIFPFRDKCTPESGKLCFSAQIGLCPGVCGGAVKKKEYASQIKRLINFLNGDKKSVIKSFSRDMKKFVKEERFEEAVKTRNSLSALEHIQDVTLLKRESKSHNKNTFRIEAYDIAHMSGDSPVGVMVVIENGVPALSEYRTFKIKTAKGADDISSLGEVLQRRFKHSEWSYPNLIVIDGGEVHRVHAEKLIKDSGIKIPVVSVVKDDRHKARSILGLEKKDPDLTSSIVLANSESHRFAVTFHRKQRSKKFLPNH